MIDQQQVLEHRNLPNVSALAGPFGGVDISKQESEIEQLQAVKEQLARMMYKGQAG